MATAMVYMYVCMLWYTCMYVCTSITFVQSEQEASFQHFTEVVTVRENEISVLKGRIDEMVESLQREQYDRQREDEGHGEVIQELQRMLSQERREKEELRSEVLLNVPLVCYASGSLMMHLQYWGVPRGWHRPLNARETRSAQISTGQLRGLVAS